MFHVKLSRGEVEGLRAVLDWIGVEATPELTETLTGYAGWLVDEGVRVGGIGPNEVERIWDRHVLDSLVFGYASDAGSILDVGSGVGLPGIPLAMALPHVHLTLLDRSGRRVDALGRLAAMFSLDVTIVQGDVAGVQARFDRVVLRASLTVDAARKSVPGLLAAGGDMVFGLGRGDQPDAVRRWRDNPWTKPEGGTIELLSTPPGILDSPSWLLRMRMP